MSSLVMHMYRDNVPNAFLKYKIALTGVWYKFKKKVDM
jgi:hypothetical protein